MNILTDTQSSWSKEVMMVILVIIRNAQMLNMVKAFIEKRISLKGSGCLPRTLNPV